MDSSLPVLVSRLADRRALTRLVRAALRHEVAQVELASAPQHGEAHTLDLHVAGEPPLALLAEPAGAPTNGYFPLRLRPLYRAQAAQLQALLDDERPEDAPPPEPTPSPPNRTLTLDADAVGARVPRRPMPIEPSTPQPLPARHPPEGKSDPRRTVPLATWGLHEKKSSLARGPEPDDVDEPSLSVNVVFDADDNAVAVNVMNPPPPARSGNTAAFAAPPVAPPHRPPLASIQVDFEDEPSPADVEEPSLSVSVVFEPEVVANLLAGVSSPLGDDDVTKDEVLPAATEAPPGPSLEDAHDAFQSMNDGFFDSALANFPSMTIPPTADEGSPGPAPEDDPFPHFDALPLPLLPSDAHEEPPAQPLAPPRHEEKTLVRRPSVAISAARPEKPAEPVVRPESRDHAELTPTQQFAVSGIDLPDIPKKTTRKKPAYKLVVPPDEEDTAAQYRPPVAAPGPPKDPALGRRVAEGKYIIESPIGSGAAGSVYRATHRELRRTVAIKLLHPHYQQDPQFMTSFRGEALAASQLDHPNVMRVLDFGQEPDGLVYIVMEYLSGRTLQNLLDEEQRLPTERAVEVMIQVCAALSVAHDHGIIHRDIKPDNIMLVPSRNDEGKTYELVKVCDFGIAALQNPHIEDAELAAAEHVIAGTPEYMSPEQARGREVDARSDVYACGICLYELVTGRPPFLGQTTAEILIKQLEDVAQPPSQLVKGLDPIIEEIILRAIQKDPRKRHQSARELRVELKELIDPGEGYTNNDKDELSIVENVPVLDDPASGFPGFFIALSSAVLRFGRFERGHTEAAQATKELQKQMRIALRGRTELTFARRDVETAAAFCVMSGTAEIVDLRRLLGSQLMGSFGEPFVNEVVNKGIAALTLREGIPDNELQYLIEMLLGPFAHEELRKEMLSKPLRYISILFDADVIGRDRKLSWKVGLCISRLTRDLRALCNVRGISLKKMRETRDELVGGVARLLTRSDEVKQFLYNADLVDESVANLRGFSQFSVAPLVVERVLHESCAETATVLLHDLETSDAEEQDRIRPFLRLFADRLVTERSAKSDAAVGEFYRRKIISEDDMPRDLKESIRAATLADALVREPTHFLLTLDLITDPETYEHELTTLEAAMTTLARRSEAVALYAVMSTLARHAKGAAKGPRESAALRVMKSMIDKQRLLPIASILLLGSVHQRESARQLIVIAGSVGASALYEAREATADPAARPIFVKALKDTGPAGWTLLSQVLPRMEVRDDNELALVEDLLRAMPDRLDHVLGDAVAKFLPHPLLRQTALTAIVPLWGERAKKPLVEALEYADEPTRIVALAELRRIHAIDEYVFSVVERFLTMKGSAGEELRIAAASALVDASTALRTRAVQLLGKAVEGKRGLVAMLRGSDSNDETVAVLEAMGVALLTLDRAEGIKALKGRVSRSDGATRQRLLAVLSHAQAV